LLENINEKDNIIKDFSKIDNLREWLRESYFKGKNDPCKFGEVREILKSLLKIIAVRYSLQYVED
jgi:hypothetical protein